MCILHFTCNTLHMWWSDWMKLRRRRMEEGKEGEQAYQLLSLSINILSYHINKSIDGTLERQKHWSSTKNLFSFRIFYGETHKLRVVSVLMITFQFQWSIYYIGSCATCQCRMLPHVSCRSHLMLLQDSPQHPYRELDHVLPPSFFLAHRRLWASISPLFESEHCRRRLAEKHFPFSPKICFGHATIERFGRILPSSCRLRPCH